MQSEQRLMRTYAGIALIVGWKENDILEEKLTSRLVTTLSLFVTPCNRICDRKNCNPIFQETDASMKK